MTQAGVLDEVNVRRSGMSGVTTQSRPAASLLERLLSALLGKAHGARVLFAKRKKGKGAARRARIPVRAGFPVSSNQLFCRMVGAEGFTLLNVIGEPSDSNRSSYLLPL
jgi:hypothetical protein